jgi:hypothetical protein
MNADGSVNEEKLGNYYADLVTADWKPIIKEGVRNCSGSVESKLYFT